MTTSDITVLVVDDQDLLRSGIAMTVGLAPGMRVVGEAPDGRLGVERAMALDPDVVLMDIVMPEMDGIGATRRLAELGARSAVVLLTTFPTDEHVFDGLRAGASAFLLKDSSAEQIVDAVRVVAAGEAVVAPRVTRRLIDACRDTLPTADTRSTGPDRARAALSEREFEVYESIAEGLSNAEIAARLFLGEATVKTHVGRVLAKLELRDRVHVAIHAHR